VRQPAVRALLLLAIAELLAMTLWFSATAVMPALVAAWALSPTGAAWLTAAVQAGFVVGALGSAVFNLPDVLPPRRMFALAAVAGALVNLLLAWVADGIGAALVLRFLTGVALAGVYPPGMKIAAGHVSGRGRGLAIGALVGSLTLGSATPHLVAGLLDARGLSHVAVLTVSSALALVGALIVATLVTDGPYAPGRAPFDPRQLGRVLRDRAVLLAYLGYFGHMWELYAFWAFVPPLVVAYNARTSEADLNVSLLAFATIAAGALGCVVGGYLSLRFGSARVARVQLAASGVCCLLSPLMFQAPPVLFAAFLALWGIVVVGDSPQFSALNARYAPSDQVGSALTIANCIGFGISIVSIQLLNSLAGSLPAQHLFLLLVPGPIFGLMALLPLLNGSDPGAQ
jgi:MFS family permease